MKDYVLNFFIYKVLTQRKIAKIFVDVTYKYDVGAKVINDIISHNDDKKVRVNN